MEILSEAQWNDLILMIDDSNTFFEARISSVINGLTDNPKAAFEAANQPSLWDKMEFIKRLLYWIEANVVKSDQYLTLGYLNKKFASISVAVPGPAERWKPLAKALWVKEFRSIAKYLFPAVEASLKPPPPARIIEPSHYQTIIELAGLADKPIESGLLRDLERGNNITEPDSGEHAFSSLAGSLLRIGNPSLLPPEWALCLWSDIESDTLLLDHQDSPNCVPAFELWFSLSRLGLGVAAVKFIKTAAQHSPNAIDSDEWWSAMLGSLSRCLVRGDDRLDATLTYLIGYANPINMTQPQRQALRNALKAHGFVEEKLVNLKG